MKKMNFKNCITQEKSILMEGALGERLKREYNLRFDENIAVAGLIYTGEGRAALRALWLEYMGIAKRYGLPFLATTPTRRANAKRVAQSSFDLSIIMDNVRFLREIQREGEIESESKIEMYVGGLMGCKGDAYTGEDALSESEAKRFHAWQADLFREAEVDFLYAGIMPTLPEAAGMAQAMDETKLHYIISFTINKDGTLVDKTSISDAIAYIDSSTVNHPICYMTNCVHPRILSEALAQPINANELVQSRFWGIQANTSPLSFAELDGSVDLKCSPPEAFAQEMVGLRNKNSIKIFGGCCGTDARHMEAIARRL